MAKNSKKNNSQRKSINDSKTSDSSSENVTEESLNMTFQSNEFESFRGTDFSGLSTSGGSTSTPKSDRNRSEIKSSSSSKSSSPRKTEVKISNKNSSISFINSILLGGLAVALIYFSFGRTNVTSEDEESKLISIELLKQNMENSFDELKSQFLLKDETVWDDLHSGILDVIDFNRQAIFLLIYSDNGNTVYKLSEAVGKIATQTIKSDEVESIVVTSRDLNNEPYSTDHGKLITKLRDELEEKGVLIVHDLHLVKGTVARAFHTICDQYNTPVKQSVIIFTMSVNDLNGKSAEIGTNRLNEVWSPELKIDILQALVTRLTGAVLKIQLA